MSHWDGIPQPHEVPANSVYVDLSSVQSISGNIVVTSTASTVSRILVIVAGTLIVLLVLASVMIPVSLALTYAGPFATAKSGISSTTVTTTTTATMTSSTPQCSSYTIINDSTRLATAAGGTSCDSPLFNSTTTWIRFSGSGGTQLVTSAPSISACDAQAPGWYSGSLPISGNTVTGEACYAWSSNDCYWSNTIQVTDCGSFYVWGLVSPPECSLRYCTE